MFFDILIEDNESYFYLNEVTEVTLWEPPIVGYVLRFLFLFFKWKSLYFLYDDRTTPNEILTTSPHPSLPHLLLKDGRIIPDPHEILKKMELERKKREKWCIECDTNVAVYNCDQCKDRFCLKCWLSNHKSGKRLEHTRTNIGPIPCQGELKKNIAFSNFLSLLLISHFFLAIY